MKKIILPLMLCFQLCSIAITAQEKFDIVSFKTPVGWQKEVKSHAVQFGIEDVSKGTFGLMMLFKSFSATSDESRLNFNSAWTILVEDRFSKVTEPQMQPPGNENGWNIESGLAQYENEGTKGVAMLISATGGGKVVNLLVLTNTNAYQAEIIESIKSIVLPKVQPQKTSPIFQANQSESKVNAVSAPIVGLWTSYINETSGYINGMPQTTGGYFRKEYRLNSDGTYTFLEKDFTAYSKTIFFKYETGNWSVNGNQLTITPMKGKNETWSKCASGRTNEWGSLLKTENGRLEKITYTFELKYLSGMGQTYLIISYGAPTERDGRQNNNANQSNIWQYSPLALDKSLIDLPTK